MPHPYSVFENTPLWHVIEEAIEALENNGDFVIRTPREYIIGSLCQRLTENEFGKIPSSPGA